MTLCAFDLLELDGVDLRREPIEVRKRTLSRLLRRKHAGISFNRHFDVEGDHLPARLCARLRRHRVEAAGLTLSTGSAGLLDQSQKPGCASAHRKPICIDDRMPASSSATAPGRRLRIFIWRKNRVGAQRPSCSRRLRPPLEAASATALRFRCSASRHLGEHVLAPDRCGRNHRLQFLHWTGRLSLTGLRIC